MKFPLISILLLIFINTGYSQSKVKFITTKSSGIPSDLVSSLLLDSKENLWVGTNDKGLAMFDGNSWTYYNMSNVSVLESDYINDIKEHPNGDMWFGTLYGIAKYSNGSWTFYDTTHFDITDPFQMYVQFDSKGAVYTLNYNKPAETTRVFKFENSSWNMYHEDTAQFFTTNSYQQPRDFVIDQNDVIWAKNGSYLDGPNWKKVPFTFQAYANYDGCIAVDLNNIIWFAAYRTKYTKISIPASWDGTTCTPYDTMKSYNDYGFNLLIRVNPNNGDVWYSNIDWTVSGFSYPKRGLSEWYDGSTWHQNASLNSIIDSATHHGVKNMSIKDMAFDKKGNVWFGLNNAGEYRKQFPDEGGIIIFNKDGVDLTNFPVGIKNKPEDLNSINLYPNPAGDQITIEFTKDSRFKSGMIRVLDINGREVHSKELHRSNGNSVLMDVSSLSEGIYTLAIQDDAGSAVEYSKFVKE